MANRITPEQKQKMLELYNELGTYSAVAKEMGISTSTATKYIKESKAIKTYNDVFTAKPIEEINFSDLKTFSLLTKEEKNSYMEWLKEFGR